MVPSLKLAAKTIQAKSIRAALGKLIAHSYRLQRRGSTVIDGEKRLALPDSTHNAILPVPRLQCPTTCST